MINHKHGTINTIGHVSNVVCLNFVKNHLIYKSNSGGVCVCVGNAWKILPITAHSPEIIHLNTLNKAFLTVSVFGHLEFACTGGVHQNLDMEFLRT